MSTDCVAWARVVEIKPHSDKASDKRASIPVAHAVLMVLASHAHPETGESFPKRDTIAWEVRRHPRTVVRAIRLLELNGHIKEKPACNRGGRNQEKIWIVNPKKYGKRGTSESSDMGYTGNTNRGGRLSENENRGVADCPKTKIEGWQPVHLRGGSLSLPYKEERVIRESTERKTPPAADFLSVSFDALLKEYPPESVGEPESARRVFLALAPSADLLKIMLNHVRAKSRFKAAIESGYFEGFCSAWPYLVKYLRRRQWEWDKVPDQFLREGRKKRDERIAGEEDGSESIPEFSRAVVEESAAVWGLAKESLRGRLDHESFGAWIESLRPIGLNGSGLYMSVPSHFFRDHITACFGEQISEELARVRAGDPSYRIVVRDFDESDCEMVKKNH